MTNKYVGETKVKLGDIEKTMRPTINCMIAIESELGKGILEVINDLSAGKVSFKAIESVVYNGLKAYGYDTPRHEVGELIMREGLVNVAHSVVTFLMASLGMTIEDAKESSEGKPEAPAK
jgi:hypothetical protein